MQSSVKHFFANKHIFITGSTGFLGSVVVEKLLRSFPDVAGLYLLIRKKKKRDENFKATFFENELFERMRKENPKYAEKVHWIEGDLSRKVLGLSGEDVGLFREKIQTVMHIGASIKLSKTNLHETISCNLQGTRELLELAKASKNIECFMNVSTVYVNTKKSQRHLVEKIYPTTMSPADLLNLTKILPPKILDTVAPQIILDWPQPYSFIKYVTENLCMEYANYFNVGIFRPGHITSTYQEPFPYWAKGSAGIIGFVAGISSNLIKSSNLKTNVASQAVPVDLLVATCKVATTKSQEILVYNYTSSNHPISYADVFEYAVGDLPNAWKFRSQNKLFHATNDLFLNVIPAYGVDTFLHLIGRKPKYVQMYKRLHLWDSATEHLRTHHFDVDVDNTLKLWASLSEEDRALLNFDVKQIDWQEYFQNIRSGIDKYILRKSS